MSFGTKWTLVLGSLLLPTTVFSQDINPVQIRTVTEKPDYCYQAGKLFDPEVLQANKQREIEGLRVSASMGDEQSQYLMGSLYRLGEKHPANLFAEDSAKAKVFLSNAAIAGNYQAMAGMAEIELKNKNYRDAMLWAQVFAHYSEIDALKRKDTGNQAYQAYLLQRIMQFTNKDKKLYSDQVFREDLLNFHASYNHRIMSNRSDEKKKAEALKYASCLNETKSGPGTIIEMVSGPNINAGEMTARKMKSPGYAMFLLLIDSKGNVLRAITVDSLPDASYARALGSVAKRLRFNEVAGPEIRSAYLPLSFDDFSVAMKKVPAKK